MSQIVENALSRNVEESFKKFLDPDPEADLTALKNHSVESWIRIHERINFKIQSVLSRTGAYVCMKFGEDRC